MTLQCTSTFMLKKNRLRLSRPTTKRIMEVLYNENVRGYRTAIDRKGKPYDQGRSKSLLTKCLLSFLTLAATGVSVYLSLLLPVFSMPEPTGSYAVGTISLHLTDESRDETFSADPNDKRELMVNVWYPADREEAKGKPVEHYPSELGEAISLVFGAQ
ncbi:hypothetical protein [Paenibacillus sp. MSJ-34]|uniref:hypothetical protein n=1 Tax=Paenibacillus sp. MSJ-34 TaxID=2841529 RepID=UPI001C1008F3|nr:hypothetical protein [Paenibacillus sp. MSJ-34]MBU5443627.1 hypothetical protein [Paenibacillus sp. MSJ-34]